MKKIIRSPLVAGLVILLSLLPNPKKGELKDVAKPYLGFYQCIEAKLNEEDLLSRFKKLDLELKSDETFILHYCEEDGRARTETGRYTYDCKKGILTLQGKNIQREFPLKEGTLTLTFSFAGQNLTLRFEQK